MAFSLRITAALLLLAIAFCGYFLSKPALRSDTDTTFMSTLREQQVPNTQYVIRLPKDYRLEEKEGPDFSVYFFSLTDTTAKADFHGGFYLGNYPSLFDHENDSCAHEAIQAEVLDIPSEWTLYDCQHGFSFQTIVATNSPERWDSYIHAFGHGVDDDALTKMVTIFSTLKRKD